MLSCEITQQPYSKSAFVIITDKVKFGFSLNGRPKTTVQLLPLAEETNVEFNTILGIPDHVHHHEFVMTDHNEA